MDTSAVVNADTIYQSTPAWRAMRILSDFVAKPPLKLMRKDKDGQIVEAVSHPLYRLLRYDPAPYYTSFNWRSACMDHALRRGNALSEIVRDSSGIPRRLILLPIDQYRGWEIKNDELYYLIGPNQTMVSAENFVHISGPTNDGIQGINVIDAHRMTFSADMSSRKYSETLWKNGASLTGYIKYPERLSEEAFGRLKTSWEQEYAGAHNAGKTAILEGGAEYQQLGMTPQESGLYSSQKQSVEEISRIFGVPLHMLSSLDEATFNNIEHLTMTFLRDTMYPWYERWTQELDRKLLTRRERDLGYYFTFDTSGLSQAPLETMSEYYVKMFNIGVLNQNEIRHELKRNAIPLGDRYFVQGNNMIPTDAIDEILETKTSNPQQTEEVDVDGLTEDT